MRRILVLGTLLALTGAASAEARCRAVLEDDGTRLGRTKYGWVICGTGVTFPRTGRPVALDTQGRALTVRFRRGARTIITWVARGGGEPLMRDMTLGRGQRFVRQVLSDGDLYVAVDSRRPHVRRLRTFPTGVIDRSRGLDPRSLRRSGDGVQWRVGADVRRLGPRGRDVPPADCRVPAYATAPLRGAEAVAYELRLGTAPFEGTVYGCAAPGPPRPIAETADELVVYTTRPVALAGPFGLFLGRSVWKRTSEQLIAYDLRSGERTAAAEVRGGLMETVLSGTGALAFSQRVAEQVEVVAARGETAETLDSGPGVDGRSLKLEGATLSWIHGAQRRTAELP